MEYFVTNPLFFKKPSKIIIYILKITKNLHNFLPSKTFHTNQTFTKFKSAKNPHSNTFMGNINDEGENTIFLKVMEEVF
jgi:hypothetical protein